MSRLLVMKQVMTLEWIICLMRHCIKCLFFFVLSYSTLLTTSQVMNLSQRRFFKAVLTCLVNWWSSIHLLSRDLTKSSATNRYWLFHDDRLLQQYEELWNHRFWQHSEYPPLLQVTFPQLCNKKDVFKNLHYSTSLYSPLLEQTVHRTWHNWNHMACYRDSIVTRATCLWAFFLKFGPSPDLNISCITPSRFTSQCLNISYKIFPLWLIYFASQCVDIQ